MKSLRINTSNVVDFVVESNNYENNPLSISTNPSKPTVISITLNSAAQNVLLQGRFILTGTSGDSQVNSTVTLNIYKNSTQYPLDTMVISLSNGQMQMLDIFSLDNTYSYSPCIYTTYLFSFTADNPAVINWYTLSFMQFTDKA